MAHADHKLSVDSRVTVARSAGSARGYIASGVGASGGGRTNPIRAIGATAVDAGGRGPGDDPGDLFVGGRLRYGWLSYSIRFPNGLGASGQNRLAGYRESAA